MNKQIYLIRGTKNESYEEFSKRLKTQAHSLSKEKEILQVKLTFTAYLPPKVSIIPFKKQKIAAISVYKNDDQRIEELINEPGFSGAYDVEEAIPVSYEKQWNDMEPTPGVCLLTLFKQKKGIDHNTFIDRWHNSHTPLSLKIHPLWNYNRNVVGNKLQSDSESWGGIVEEHFKKRSDLLNPLKFFGHPLPYRMWQVYSDTKSFLDYKTIETYLATEVYIKS